MIWENWLVATSVGVIAIAFVVLVVYVILALKTTQSMLRDLDLKIHSFDPLFRIVSKAGLVIEKKATQELEDVEEALAKEPRRSTSVNTAMDVAEWALIGVSLWQKIKERRR